MENRIGRGKVSMALKECNNRSFPENPIRIVGNTLRIPLISEESGFCYLLQDECKYPDKGSNDCPIARGEEKVTRYGARGDWNIL